MRFGACILIFICNVVVAQDITTTSTIPHEYDSIRSYYIKRFPNHFFIYPVIKQRSLNFELERINEPDDIIAFKPNNTYSLGAGFYLFELGFEVAFAIPLKEKSIGIYGESDARDIQLNILSKKWGVDLFYQKYSGFYLIDSNNPVQPDQPYPQRPDLDSRNYGITGIYVFNNRKFSFRSAYNFVERQVFSKGSLLLFSSLSSFRVLADSSIIGHTQRDRFASNVWFKKLQYATLSLAPGYTYSVVYKGFFLNGSLSIGPAHHWIAYQLDNGPERYQTSINTFIATRIGLGYNGERMFGGITFITQGSNVKFEDVRFSNNNGAFKILIGYRFRESGFLKKRVWDLVPFDI
jgi:hypothetical protein